LDDADLRELEAVFLLDAPGRLERIGRHLEDAGIDAAANEAHSLCGAAATVQLEELARQAELLEEDLRAARPRVARARERLDTIAALLGGLDLEANRATALRAPGPAQRTVLHVEDNPVNVALVERALARRPGVRLLSATAADAGLRLAGETRPDLILLDLNLPDGSGRELLRRLRSEPETRDVPVVVVSGHTPERIAGSLNGLGVREYLTKPLDIGRLLELVDEHAPTVDGDA
jgi:CheY-like chemotaxis protein/HPt (histidine-containing phosphotransfer) domain-containing protein